MLNITKDLLPAYLSEIEKDNSNIINARESGSGVFLVNTELGYKRGADDYSIDTDDLLAFMWSKIQSSQ